MKAEILKSTRSYVSQAFISEWIKLASNAVRKDQPHLWRRSQGAQKIVIAFVDIKEMALLNFEYRGKIKPTDILSFDPVEDGHLGELVLCPEIILQQAAEHQMSRYEEYGYMLLHGMLHLLGLDHEKSRAQAQEMFAIQDAIFAKLCKKSKFTATKKVVRSQKAGQRRKRQPKN